MNHIDLCTVSDKHYLLKTVALYLSLEKTTRDFTLWVLCIDKTTLKLLSNLNLKRLKTIKLSEIEDQELKEIKRNRTRREYAWTLKSSFIYYLLTRKAGIKKLIYTDSDMAFFSDANDIPLQAGDSSIGITEHNFLPYLKPKEKTVGKYNSGIVYFKNAKEAQACSKYWKDKCIEYCSYEVSQKGVGDQVYLADWPDKFKSLTVFKHKGINLAPWSVGNYEIAKLNNKVLADKDRLICYHFHGFKTHPDGQFTNTFGYAIDKNAQEFIYKPYKSLVKAAIELINTKHPSFKFGIEKKNTLVDFINAFYRYFAPIYSKFVELTGFQYKIYKN